MERISSQHFAENCAQFDDAGNLLEITERDPEGRITYTFTYDDLYQLNGEKGIIDAQYKNDSLYNRLKKNKSLYTINGLNQLTAESGTSYIYDKNGNPIQIGPIKLFYDALDRLIAMEQQKGFRTEYAYDESHRRIFRRNLSWQMIRGMNTKRNGSSSSTIVRLVVIDASGTIKDFRVIGLGRGAELGAYVVDRWYNILPDT